MSELTTVLSIEKPKESQIKLIQVAYAAVLSSNRTAGAKTKKRGEVSGGGRKPWRQKGTGRARQGSTRSPQWVGGGVVWGPTGKENYSNRLNTKEKLSALRAALYFKDEKGAVKVVNFPELKKTKDAAAFLKGENAGKKVLILSDPGSKSLKQVFRNIDGVTIDSSESVNIVDTINADTILVTKDALDRLKSKLGVVK